MQINLSNSNKNAGNIVTTTAILINAPLDISVHSELIIAIFEYTATPNVEEEVVIENNKVTIEFSGESWVELKDKKKVYFQGVFHNGDKKEIDYVDNLFISVGRPKNVKVYVKGIEKNIVAKRRKTNIPLDSLE